MHIWKTKNIDTNNTFNITTSDENENYAISLKCLLKCNILSSHSYIYKASFFIDELKTINYVLSSIEYVKTRIIN